MLRLDLAIFSSSANALVEAVKQNGVLKQVEFCNLDNKSIPIKAVMPQVNHLFALNHGGGKILKSPSVPPSLWPQIRGRSSNDPNVLFFSSLQEKSDVLLRGLVEPVNRSGMTV